jgi:hypothetical protein
MNGIKTKAFILPILFILSKYPGQLQNLKEKQ